MTGPAPAGGRFDAIVVGGGIAGCASAWRLAAHGMSVALFEKGRIGAGASGVNFGGVRQQGRHPAEIPLSRRARAIWSTLEAQTRTPLEFNVSGHIKLAFDEAEMADLERYAATAAGLGLRLELLTARAVRAAHPWLSARVAGASLCTEDGSANPRLVAPAIARRAAEMGAAIRPNTRLVSFEHGARGFTVSDGRAESHAPILVNAAGAWGAAIAARFGEPVPLVPIAPHCMVSEPVAPLVDRALGVCGGAVAIRQTAQGSVVIGGGLSQVDMEAGHARPLSATCVEVLRHAVRVVPALAHASIVRAWAGVEGDMPDHVPVVGPSRTTPGLLHAFGFSQHGFQLGPGVGETIAELAATGAPGVDISGLDIGRFAAA